MDGVANNVKILTVRVVPDGDEHDKDVALGIRYAVDNGAKIINTSFGKAYSPNKQWVFDAIRSGASGYLLKDTPRAGLIEAIKGTAEGKTHISPEVAGKLFTHIAQNPVHHDTSIADSLSRREREVLRLLARGLPNAEIARQLHLSEGTVRNYVSGIFTKLEVSDRTQAAVLAWRHRLVDLRNEG